jgi:tight adherence protein B
MLSENPAIQSALLQLPRIGKLDQLLLQSGLSWSVAKLAGLTLLTAAVSLLAGMFAGLPSLLQLMLGGLGTTLPFFKVTQAKAKRMTRIEHQLPDALDLMSRAMRAGHAFPNALKMVGDEMSDPLGAEFRTAFDEVNFGIALPEAMQNLARRVPSTDLRYFVVAVLIQRETGGNLADLLTNISNIIRDRIKLLGQIRVLSTEGRVSSWVLSLLPFGAASLMHLVNPEFLKILYTDPIGIDLLTGAIFLMLTGILVMRNIARIRV